MCNRQRLKLRVHEAHTPEINKDYIEYVIAYTYTYEHIYVSKCNNIDNMAPLRKRACG